MPRAIADSDDDESDDVLSLAAGNDAEDGDRSARDFSNAETPSTALNETVERSTCSTELLRREIQSVERRLFQDSASGDGNGITHMAAANPPIEAGVKRRHTAALGAEANSSPSTSAKRIKSMKTYSSNRHLHLPDADGFVPPADDAAAPRTSQSAKFTGHSGLNSSAFVPSGSVGEDFSTRQPMFHDSGSTVADNSSTQQRLLEEANASDAQSMKLSLDNDLVSGQIQSSSFPWTASGSHQRSGSSGQQQSQITAAAELMPETLATNMNDTTDEVTTVGQTCDTSYVTANAELHSTPSNSPIVEIHQQKRRASTSSQRSSVSSQTAAKGKGRKRKAAPKDHDTAQLNSDDHAIGLPKELYQPRPSRRRATEVPAAPVDLSVRPEKAAKMKRTKTIDGGTTSSARESFVSGSVQSDKAVAPAEKAVKDAGDASADVENSISGAKASADNHSQNDKQVQKDSNANGAGQSTQQSENLSQGSQKSDEAEIFVKPPKPTPKRKSGLKTKRSHTTIFEDHVEFVGSQRTPNLNQQQAKRKSAMKVASSEAASTQRKRKSVVSDDEEDDGAEATTKDANEDVEEDEEPPVKKRGRGRPKKSTVRPQPKSTEKILDDSEDAGEEVIEADPGVPSKKRGKGRPSKAASEAQSKDIVEHEASETPTHGAPLDATENDTTNVMDKDHPTEPDTTPNANRIAGKIPTPSPEKENAPQHTDPKPSPTSHSPIKSSSRVPLRVGLSKRQRIPSLLRVMKPPPPTR